MVILSLITATVYLVLMLVAGSLEHFNSSPTAAAPSVFVATHDSHAHNLAKCLFLITLGEAYHNPACYSFVVQTYYPNSG